MSEAITACKKLGVYPFYTAKVVAAAFYAESEKADSEIYKGILTKGIRSAAEAFCGFALEPEMSYWVAEAYGAILDGSFFTVDARRVALVRAAYEEGFANEAVFGGCAQCTMKSFFTVTDGWNEKTEHLFRAVSGMSGGIACNNDSACGAYSAGNIVMGTFVGRQLGDMTGPDADPLMGPSNDLGTKLHDKFMDVFGTTICCGIHKGIFGRTYQFKVKDDLDHFMAAGAHEDKCPTVVGLSASWATEILYDEGLIK